MSDCCCPPPAVTSRPACPSCSTRGGPVEVQTLKALLTPNALGQLRLGGFHFCAEPGCDTVYFAGDGQVFRTTDLRVEVWQKQPSGNRTICYCFGENEADIRREVEQHGRTQAVERVRRHIQDRRCACEVRNPRGTCCLGDLTAAVKRLGIVQGAHL